MSNCKSRGDPKVGAATTFHDLAQFLVFSFLYGNPGRGTERLYPDGDILWMAGDDDTLAGSGLDDGVVVSFWIYWGVGIGDGLC